MPKYHVHLYYSLAEEYEVEAADEEAAIEAAKVLNDQETDEEMMARAELEFDLEDSWADEIKEE
jgi:hypothetical protein